MQNSNVHAVGISDDVKMTRIFLATPSSFFGTTVETPENVDEVYVEEHDA